jgi:hypothetical protein
VKSSLLERGWLRPELTRNLDQIASRAAQRRRHITAAAAGVGEAACLEEDGFGLGFRVYEYGATEPCK